MATTSGFFRFLTFFYERPLKAISVENFLKLAARTLVNPYCEFTISFGKVWEWRREIFVLSARLFLR